MHRPDDERDTTAAEMIRELGIAPALDVTDPLLEAIREEREDQDDAAS
jgi:hypothetical protein